MSKEKIFANSLITNTKNPFEGSEIFDEKEIRGKIGNFC